VGEGVFMQIEVTGDIDKLLKLDGDIKFAAASALTKAVKLTQDSIVTVSIPAEFHVRGTWWRPGYQKGINMLGATKQNQEAVLFTRADWLLEAEGNAGGVKTPDRGGQHLAVPDTENTRHGIEKKIRKAEKPRYLLDPVNKKRSFKVNTQGGYTLILQRKGRGKKSYLVTKYIFRNEVRVPHQSAIIEPANRIIPKVIGGLFIQQLSEAIRTSRVKE
jgi:hypothetical protein